MPNTINNIATPRFVIHGPGSLQQVGQWCARMGTKGFVGTGLSSMRTSGQTEILEKALEEFGLPYVAYEGIEPDPTVDAVDAGAQVAREEGCDVFVALGGGAVIDCIKSIALLATNEGNASEYQSGDKEVSTIIPTIIVIPTTSGSGSESSSRAYLRNDEAGMTRPIISNEMVPEVVILDPLVTEKMPKEITASSAMLTFANALDSLLCTTTPNIGRASAIGAIEALSNNLRPACANGNDLLARTELMNASYMAGTASSMGSGIITEMTLAVISHLTARHQKSANFGTVAGILIPYCIEANTGHNNSSLIEIARALGEDVSARDETDSAWQAVEGSLYLTQDVGMPKTLATLGIKEPEIPDIVKKAKGLRLPTTNKRRVDDQIRREILRSAIRGDL